MNNKVEQVMAFAAVDQPTAEKALLDNDNDVVMAITSLTPVPVISGNKHIPPPPKVDDGHDEETRERIRKGRILADILTYAPQNDLRGKASHYPAREEQTLVAECKEQPVQPSPSVSQ